MFRPFESLGQCLARYLSRSRPTEHCIPTSRFELLAATIRPGDVLLVEGSSRFSTAIKYLTQSSWSHAGLYVGATSDAEADRQMLIEADVLAGVQAIPLQTYAGWHVRICRPVGLNEDEIHQVLAHVIDRIGQRYDIRNIVDLLRYLLPTPPIPGRWRRRILALGSGDPTRAICSSLIAEAFQSVRYPILPDIEPSPAPDPQVRKALREMLHIRHSSLFAPRDFDISPYFHIVKPMLEHGFDPHHLQWAESSPGLSPVNPTAPL